MRAQERYELLGRVPRVPDSEDGDDHRTSVSI
jgi:hypothetical protein